MGFWSLYFILKLVLFYVGKIGFDVPLNLALAVAVAIPLRQRWQRIVRLCVALPLGIALLYHDSYLPPFSRVVQTLPELLAFSPLYIAELLLRFVDVGALLGLVALVLFWLLLAHRLRMATFVFLGILTVPLVPMLKHALVQRPVMVANAGAPGNSASPSEALTDDGLTSRLNAFYASNKERTLQMSKLPADTPFDLIVLHICSLAWDDMDAVGQKNDRLIGRFDVLFSNFNSAASYSGPAAIRLMRSLCGQAPHADLYQPARPECEWMAGLQGAGFETHWLMNHDGKYGDFRGDVLRNLGVEIKQEVDPGAAIGQRAFDNSPIYSDYDMLSRWWQRRLANPSPHVALYYNGISLHDGNRVEGVSRDLTESYRYRLSTFLSDINRFMDLVGQSGRRVMIVVVPEHGAAIHGDRKQIPGMREIPTPAITHVPVGVKLLGPDLPSVPQQIVDAPTSFFALNELLSRLFTASTFTDPREAVVNAIRDLPQTESVAENEGTVIMQVGSSYQERTPDGSWSAYDMGPR